MSGTGSPCVPRQVGMNRRPEPVVLRRMVVQVRVYQGCTDGGDRNGESEPERRDLAEEHDIILRDRSTAVKL
jgi:hypothetical protein